MTSLLIRGTATRLTLKLLSMVMRPDGPSWVQHTVSPSLVNERSWLGFLDLEEALPWLMPRGGQPEVTESTDLKIGYLAIAPNPALCAPL